MYALVSYKAMYSKFSSAREWKEIAPNPTPRLLAKATIRDRSKATYFVIRSPHKRTVSCFMDKFRKQPTRINEPGFEWQACHKLLYPICAISRTASNEEIASRFLDFSFDEFIEVLLQVYRLDGHFQPQSWTRKLIFGRNRLLNWPNCKLIRMEDADALQLIPGIDWTVKTNVTEHIKQDFDQLKSQGFEFWSEPAYNNFGPAVGETMEGAFDGPDGVVINLVELMTKDPKTLIGNMHAFVTEYGRTSTGFTPVVTTAHSERLVRLPLFYGIEPESIQKIIEELKAFYVNLTQT